MFELITIILCLVIMILFFWKFKRPKGFPPGPAPYPFVGNTFQMLKENVIDDYESWAKKYGPVVGFSNFSDLFIAVNGTKAVIEALQKEEFQNRPDTTFLRQRSFGKLLGLFFGQTGPQWASTRKFVVRNMKSFGRNETEYILADEIEQFMDTIKDNSIVEATGLFKLPAVNVIWLLIANTRFDKNDETSNILESITYFFRNGNPSGADIFTYFPFLQFISAKQRNSGRAFKEIQDFIEKTIEEHREALDLNNPVDLIDKYLVEMEKTKSSVDSYFSEEDLIITVLDLFTAGAESIGNSVEFILLYMVLYPDIQRRLQEELDTVLCRQRKPVLNDKTEMHYTMSVLSEVERLNSIAPLTAMHCCTRDTEFFGYFIPKGTQININLHSLGNDAKTWKEPDNFNPERFLNANGKFTKSPNLQPFGSGQRACVGEIISRNTIFLFTTTFLEKYSVSLPPGEHRPSTDPLPGFTTAPRPFNIHISSRY